MIIMGNKEKESLLRMTKQRQKNVLHWITLYWGYTYPDSHTQTDPYVKYMNIYLGHFLELRTSDDNDDDDY